MIIEHSAAPQPQRRLDRFQRRPAVHGRRRWRWQRRAREAQYLNTLLGKILRINPHDPAGAGRRSTRSQQQPVSRQEVAGTRSGRDGFRNPWRCSFDQRHRHHLVRRCRPGLVGRDRSRPHRRQEFRLGVPRGLPLLQLSRTGRGASCVPATAAHCRSSSTRTSAGAEDNNSVVGGYVSRRPGATLEGKYVFGDLGSGRIWVIPANFPAGRSTPRRGGEHRPDDLFVRRGRGRQAVRHRRRRGRDLHAHRQLSPSAG